MTLTYYKHTARKALNKTKKTYLLGRETVLNGHPVTEGGYALMVISENYDGAVKGGIRKSICVVKDKLGYHEVIKLMNKRCGYEAIKATM